MACVDPTQGWYGDIVMAKIIEHINASPMVKSEKDTYILEIDIDM